MYVSPFILKAPAIFLWLLFSRFTWRKGWTANNGRREIQHDQTLRKASSMAPKDGSRVIGEKVRAALEGKLAGDDRRHSRPNWLAPLVCGVLTACCVGQSSWQNQLIAIIVPFTFAFLSDGQVIAQFTSVMTVGAFSEWRKLPVSLNELCINTTLRCGQSFR